jgi:hypothetical protein
MSLLEAVEYTISDPERRIVLYRRCAEDRSVHGMDQDDHRLLEIASSVAMDLASLEPHKVEPQSARCWRRIDPSKDHMTDCVPNGATPPTWSPGFPGRVCCLNVVYIDGS